MAWAAGTRSRRSALTQDPSSPPVRDEEQDRARALALLQATHKFPVEYHISVIAVGTEEVRLNVRAAVEAGPHGAISDDAYTCVPSSGGKYASHRFRVTCDSAEDVLELYARVRAVTGVITLL